MTFTKTVNDAETFLNTPKAISLAKEYIALKNTANRLKREIDAIRGQVFTGYEFYESKHNRSGEFIGRDRILALSRVWLADDDQLYKTFDNECNQAIFNAGYQSVMPDGKNILDGYCPALCADSAVRDCENKCLELMADWMGVSVPIKLDLRDSMLSIFLNGVFGVDYKTLIV